MKDEYTITNPDEIAKILATMFPASVRDGKKIILSSMEQNNITPAFAKLSPEMQQILSNAVEAGKYSQDMADQMAQVASDDPQIINVLKSMIMKARVKPELAAGKFDPNYIKQAAEKSFRALSQNGYELRELQANAPVLYAAKHVEEYGKMPQKLII